jgi:hypothetical protein
MIPDCGGLQDWDLSDFEAVFLQSAFSMLKIIIPGAICFFLWRIFVTNKKQIEVLGLGLNQTATNGTRVKCLPKFSPRLLLLYSATVVVTFNAGLLFFEACEFLRHILRRIVE